MESDKPLKSKDLSPTNKSGKMPESIKTKSDKKNAALKLWHRGNITKSDIARKVGVARCTAWAWIEKETNKTKELPVEKKIKIWQSTSVNHLHRAELVAKSLMKDLVDEKLTPANKNAFMANSMIAAGTCWDKSRLEAGKGIGNLSFAMLIRSTAATPQDVVFESDKSVIEIDDESSNE